MSLDTGNKSSEKRKSDIPQPSSAAAGSDGGNDFKSSLEAMLKRGRGGTTAAQKPKAPQPDSHEVYKIAMYDVPPEERQEQLSNQAAQSMLAIPTMAKARRPSKRQEQA